MDITGITFSGEIRDYVTLRAIKISKWIDPKDFSLDVVFHLNVEHYYRKNKFKKLKELHVYFRKDDLDKIDKRGLIWQKNERRELEEKIRPLKEYTSQIPIKEIEIEKNRIKVIFGDYGIAKDVKKRKIKFSLKFKESIVIFDRIKSTTKKPLWSYECLIEPHLVQTLKWDKREFMPTIGLLEIWLQIPKELYGSLSAINIQPVRHFDQMFLLEEEIAEDFRKAGQPLAQGETLCINWSFPNISISSPPDKIEVTCGLRVFRVEKDFVKRFEEKEKDFGITRDTILILREILYTCKVKTLDFNYIISNVSNKNLKEALKIFNTMVFRRNKRPMEENLDKLHPYLEHFRKLPYGEEFFTRYDILHALIYCKRSKDFFSEQLSSRLKKAQELEDVIDPDFAVLVQDFADLVELAKKSRYKDEVLSAIDDLYHKWTPEKLIHPDIYILTDILANWKSIIEKEYEERIPLPEIEAAIKTKHLAFSDQVGFVLSVNNIGIGEARDVHVRLVETEDYSMITDKSETKALLTSKGRPFESGLVIKPKSAKKTTVSYEIRYKDILGRDAKKQFEEHISFIKEQIPFRRIENPYIIGGVVRESKMFFGREELLGNIIDNFKGKYQTNPIFLYGQRRTGKTSIFFHLKERLKDEFVPVSFDMLEIFGEKSFYEDLMEKIKENLGFEDIKIPNIEDNPFDGFKNKFYTQFKQKLKRKKIVLMIDECQRIDEFITKGTYGDSVIDFLNALVQDGEINIIVAGYLQPEELKDKKWADLMRFFTTVNVSFLRREDVIKLICEPVKGLIEYDEGGIEKIISLSGCYPYFVQLICRTMVEYHNLNKANLIGYSNVAEHLDDYLDKGKNIFFDIIRAQTQEIEQKILSSMCNLMEEKKTVSVHKNEIEQDLINYDKSIERAETEKALSRLERREIIKRSAEHPDYYEFTIDLYKYWIKWYM